MIVVALMQAASFKLVHGRSVLAKAPEKDDPSEFVAELWSETFEIPKGRRPVLALAVPTRLATDQALPLVSSLRPGESITTSRHSSPVC